MKDGTIKITRKALAVLTAAKKRTKIPKVIWASDAIIEKDKRETIINPHDQ